MFFLDGLQPLENPWTSHAHLSINLSYPLLSSNTSVWEPTNLTPTPQKKRNWLNHSFSLYVRPYLPNPHFSWEVPRAHRSGTGHTCLGTGDSWRLWGPHKRGPSFGASSRENPRKWWVILEKQTRLHIISYIPSVYVIYYTYVIYLNMYFFALEDINV